jgi:hypothetical protein
VLFAARFGLIDYYAVYECKQSMIPAHADILPRVDPRPALANEDISCNDKLPAGSFYPKTTAGTVATVSRTSLSFFMCHDITLSLYFFDTKLSLGLTVPDFLLITGFPFELMNGDLFPSELVGDGTGDFSPLDERGPEGGLISSADHEDIGNGYFFSDLAREFFYGDSLTGGNPVLLASGFDDCVHINFLDA